MWVCSQKVTLFLLLKADTDLIDGEWKFAAMVLDRVCLITLCILTVVLTLAIFSSAPEVFVP